jgi:hypothetical protein
MDMKPGSSTIPPTPKSTFARKSETQVLNSVRMSLEVMRLLREQKGLFFSVKREPELERESVTALKIP